MRSSLTFSAASCMMKLTIWFTYKQFEATAAQSDSPRSLISCKTKQKSNKAKKKRLRWDFSANPTRQKQCGKHELSVCAVPLSTRCACELPRRALAVGARTCLLFSSLPAICHKQVCFCLRGALRTRISGPSRSVWGRRGN